MILADVTLKTAGGTLDWNCSTRLSLGMWPLIRGQVTGPKGHWSESYIVVGLGLGLGLGLVRLRVRVG